MSIPRVPGKHTAADWIAQERAQYAAVKVDRRSVAHDVVRTAIANDDMGTLLDSPFNYLKRVEQFGVTTPQGQQALGKALVTLMDYLEIVLEFYGLLPAPGHPSGELHDWI